MPSGFAARCHYAWHETHRDSVNHIHRHCSRTHQFIQDIIISGQHGKDFSLERAARPGHIVIMAVLAFVTTEFLVSPAITYLVSAFKALGHMPFCFLDVIHSLSFSSNFSKAPEIRK